MRRTLAETLVDLVDAIRTPGEPAVLRVTSVTLDLPIQVSLRQTGTELEFLADVPRWRWITVFDEPLGRLQFYCEEGAGL
jgi:hypothetical protein